MKDKIAVCSWSLQPQSITSLVDFLAQTGIFTVQLALDPIRTGEWPENEAIKAFRDTGIVVASGMMVTEGEDYSTLDTIRETGGVHPDQHWETNRTTAVQNAELASRLGLDIVSLHAGFLPEEPDDPEREKLISRLRILVDIYAEHGIDLIFETGQETAETLVEFLEELDRPTAGVNFDPANMILYDKGDPIEALAGLKSWVRQIHIKDGIRTKIPGTWGTEVPMGDGEVDWDAFFDLIAAEQLDVTLAIEREAGDDRVGDIRLAWQRVEAQLLRIGR